MPGKSINVWVPGEPKPKGSTRSFPFRKKEGGLGVSTMNANPSTKDWELWVKSRVYEVAKAKGYYRDEPRDAYKVWLSFYLSKPKSAPKWWRWPLARKRNDLDKLIRCVLDALTEVAIPDDAQVVYINAEKEYTKSNEPGVNILVIRCDPEPAPPKK